MASSTPTTEPEFIVAGDSVSWRRSLSDYPAPTWTLTYTLTNAAGVIPIVAAADGTDHLVYLAPQATTVYAAGRYTWVAQVSDGSARHSIDKGALQIAPDPATAGPVDTSSFARKMLDAIEATLEGRATDSQLDLVKTARGGRDLERNPEMLIPLRDKYRGEVAREDLEANLRPGDQGGFIQMRYL